MKRSLLLTNDYPPVVSGIATVFYQVWRRLDSADHLILTPACSKGADFDRTNGNSVTRHPAFEPGNPAFKLFNAVVQFLYTAYFIAFKRVRLIHAGQLWISGTIALICKTIFRVPYILWVYGGETTPVYMKNALSAYWAKLLLKKAKKIVANSQFCQKEFLDYGFSAEQCPIVLPGTDPGFFTPGNPPAELVRKWDAEGKIVLLTVARVSERKGHDLVIRALPRLTQKHPDILYLIAGKGPDKPRLEKLASGLGVDKYVRFAGFVPDNELPDYYRLCAVYVMPNREIFDSTDSIEGFGISFIEASACGKPVVGGKSGGASEAVKEGYSGYLVNPDSVDEFIEKTDMLLSDSDLREKIGRQGRIRAQKEMDWNSRAGTVIKLES